MGRADNLLGAGKPLNILPRIRVGSSAPTVETTSSHAQLNGGKDRHRRDPSDKSSVSKPVKQLRPDIDYYSWILTGSFILCFNAGACDRAVMKLCCALSGAARTAVSREKMWPTHMASPACLLCPCQAM